MSSDPVARKAKYLPMIPETIGGGGALYGFFADRGVRETIESVVVAVLLALLFRGFIGEAFQIPTGSMAPGLRGHHVDLTCEKCGLLYQTGASSENNLTPVNSRQPTTKTYCPVCGYRTTLDRDDQPDHRANQGDRILVNKYIYDFQEPRRFDVIVFKNPNNGKQNLIKRLCGLPGENITISRGDLYTSDIDGDNRQIVRKPPEKQLAMLQLVDDTNFRAKEMRDAGWPEYWTGGQNSSWKIVEQESKTVFSADAREATAPAWLRFRNMRPHTEVGPTYTDTSGRQHYSEGTVEWEEYVTSLKLPPRIRDFEGRLISDYYGYNQLELQVGRAQKAFHPSPGNHWVGDLAIEATLQTGSKTGSLLLDLVEGGAHFSCTIDLAAGTGQFECDDPEVQFCDAAGVSGEPPSGFFVPLGSAATLLFCNADNRLLLWVNGRLVETPGSFFNRPEVFYPSSSADDPGDAMPCGVGIVGGAVELSRLKVLRDVYYVAQRGENQNIQNETGVPDYIINSIHGSPKMWNSTDGKALFDASLRSGRPMFIIPEGCYFPMGDNSPESKDARIWEGPNYFRRELLIGRAMLVYWPHSLNRPVPFTPNFNQMRSIK